MRRAASLVALAIVTAACGSGHARGPAWPAEAKRDAEHPDGGESLEPRHGESVAAVEASTSVDSDIDALLAKLASLQEAAATEPAATKDVTTEAPITTEEIIIEINADDDDDD